MPTLDEIRDAVGGELRADGKIVITGVNSLGDAGPHQIAPFDDPKYAKAAQDSRAGALIVKPAFAEGIDRACIVHDYPLVAMNGFIEMLGLAPAPPPPGVHPSAVIDPSAHVPASCSIGASVVIGPEVRLGERCVLHPNVTIERMVTVGNDCRVDPGAVLHQGTEIGNRVTIGTGAVIGRQGFGFTASPTGPVHVHHVGRVLIGDGTSIGACCSIDRARFGVTSVGTMSGLDYGVHLGHNATVGDRTFIAAQTGLAGHAFVGNDCVVGGQTGIGNHAGVGDRSRVGAQAGLIRDYGSDRTLWGTPATDLKASLRQEAALRRLAAQKARKGDLDGNGA